jgi:hypothetical protein
MATRWWRSAAVARCLLAMTAMGCSGQGTQLNGGLSAPRNSEETLQATVDEIRSMARMYEVAAEQRVGTCMRSAGFEYYEPPPIPASGLPPQRLVDPIDPSSSDRADTPGVLPTTKEVARAQAQIEDSVPPEALPRSGGGDFYAYVDETTAYLQGLSESDRMAYGQALLGPESEVLRFELPSGEAIEFLSGGCLGHARADVSSADAYLKLQAYLYQSEGWLFALSDRVEGTQEYVDYAHEFDLCLRSVGFQLEDPQPEGWYVAGLTDPSAAATANGCLVQSNLPELVEILRDLAAQEILTSNESILLGWAEDKGPIVEHLRDALLYQ